MKNIRQRLRKTKILCVPWKVYKHELKFMPISSKCLFSKHGVPYDVLESTLKTEGYLFQDENLIEVLKVESNLYRGVLQDIGDEDADFGLVPEDFCEEDFEQLGYF